MWHKNRPKRLLHKTAMEKAKPRWATQVVLEVNEHFRSCSTRVLMICQRKPQISVNKASTWLSFYLVLLGLFQISKTCLYRCRGLGFKTIFVISKMFVIISFLESRLLFFQIVRLWPYKNNLYIARHRKEAL